MCVPTTKIAGGMVSPHLAYVNLASVQKVYAKKGGGGEVEKG